jgi:hypothetical protein
MREGEGATIGEGQDQDLGQDHAPQNIEEGGVCILNINFWEKNVYHTTAHVAIERCNLIFLPLII